MGCSTIIFLVYFEFEFIIVNYGIIRVSQVFRVCWSLLGLELMA